MRKVNCCTGAPRAVRVGLIVLAVIAGLILTLTVVLAAGTDFDSSYKIGPRFADQDDVITYTIVTVYDGTGTASNVVLSDTLPSGVELAGCVYYTSPVGSAILPCDPGHLWTEDFGPGDDVITTYIAVTVTGGTLQHPLINKAYISWDGEQKVVSCTTTLNPAYIYLPLIARNFGGS